MGNEERCVCCGEIIPEGQQVCSDCKVGKHEKKKLKYMVYKIAEGYGRFWEHVDGENSELIFGVCGRKVDVGPNPDAIRDKDRTVPVFSIVCQSPEKAMAISTAFKLLAKDMRREMRK